MKHYLYPDACADSAYDIPYQKMYDLGYRGIIYDIDNTLVPHGAPADARAIELFAELHRIGFCTVLISNNKEPRVKSFHEQVVFTQYIYKAGKPSIRQQKTLFLSEIRFLQISSEQKKRKFHLIWSGRLIKKKKSRSF